MTDFAKTYPWWLDAGRLTLGLIKRPQPQVPHLTRPKWAAELDELHRMQAWVLWNHNGRKGPRPDVWKTVPAYAKRMLAEYERAHPKPKPPPGPKPPPPPGPIPPASWTLPGPLIMTASDPGSANGHRGVGTIGRIIEQGVCPLWECLPVAGGARGLLCQVEGFGQIGPALELVAKHRHEGDHLAVVSTLNTPAQPLLDVGITVCFFELNAQAGWEPYGNVAKLDFQAGQDGWSVGRRFPSYGCYDGIGLQDYRDYVPLVTDDGGKTWHRADHPQGLEPYFACFSAEGMSDTNSWPALP